MRTVQLYAFGVDKRTLAVTAANAESFSFYAEDYQVESELPVGDGAILIFNESGHAGKEEFCKYAYILLTGYLTFLLNYAHIVYQQLT